MRLFHVASEAVPLAKTGGLADVVGALSASLSDMAHRVTVILPRYPSTMDSPWKFAEVTTSSVRLGQEEVGFGLWKADVGTNHDIWLIDHEEFFFARSELYGGADAYLDNDRRFIFFSKACLQAILVMKEKPDVIHSHDWQTGAVPYLMRTGYDSDPVFRNTASLHTIHNLAYQGVFPRESFGWLNLPESFFHWETNEFHGHLSLLKAGLTHCDLITTVSPTYAEEIQTPAFGEGLEGVLLSRADSLSGVLNGLDVDIWNPQTDPHIKSPFRATQMKGKIACKNDVCDRLGLTPNPDVLLVGVVSRLAAQKGLDQVPAALAPYLESGQVHLALLGQGDPGLAAAFHDLARAYPGRVAFEEQFSEALAHQIEAGSDAFLMPSRYEPCGLNQMISMRYGTLPIVTRVGGLKDTVIPYQEDPTRATGFGIDSVSSSDIHAALGQAISVYTQHKKAWDAMMKRAMQRDFSWRSSARAYSDLYVKAGQRRSSFLGE